MKLDRYSLYKKTEQYNKRMWFIIFLIVILMLLGINNQFLQSLISIWNIQIGIIPYTVGVCSLSVFFMLLCLGIITTYNKVKRTVLVKNTKMFRTNRLCYHIEHFTAPDGLVISTIKKIDNNIFSAGGIDAGSIDIDDFVEGESGIRRAGTECAGINGKVNNGDNNESYDINTEIPVKEAFTNKSAIDDVKGIDELKDDLERIIDSLVNPEKYAQMGAKPTKGVILYGPPGTGKTMIGKAIAHDANAKFISACGSDFIEKYVGVGAMRVRELFKKARDSKPAIIFIDAIAGHRDETNSGEDVKTVNALLKELDGFNELDGVLVIGATNRLESLDSAFTRAGRFDLKLSVPLPDKKGRLEILRVHSKNKKISKEVSLDDLVVKTVGFSGADLANLLNEAALIAAYNNKEEISNQDIEDAFFKVIMNGHRKKTEADELERKTIAWHEAGHTLAIKKLTDDGVSSVTIVGSTSGAGGVTFRNPNEKVLRSKEDIRNLIKTLYAGRAAEEILLGNPDMVTTGASADIKSATKEIRKYIEIYGMGDLALIDATQFRGNDRDSIKEATKMSDVLYKEVLTFLKENKVLLEKLANELLDKETLYEDEIDRIINYSFGVEIGEPIKLEV